MSAFNKSNTGEQMIPDAPSDGTLNGRFRSCYDLEFIGKIIP
jgi:hypothetical protein